MAGIEKENSREKAVQYNRGINDKLRTELAAMTTILLNKTDLLASNSSVYVMDLKPLVDGVTVNEILSQFDIENIDYKRLQANTDVLDYVESSVEASNLLYDRFSDQNGEVTLEGIMKTLKSGVTLSKGEISIIQNRFSKLFNSYEWDIKEYVTVNHSTETVTIKLTDEGFEGLEILDKQLEETVEELYTYKISGVYKKGDPNYIELKNSGKLADASRYLTYGGYIIDATLLSKSIAEGDLSDAFSQETILTISLIGEYIAVSTEVEGVSGFGFAVVTAGIAKLCSIPMEHIGNQIESNVDWFGDGID